MFVSGCPCNFHGLPLRGRAEGSSYSRLITYKSFSRAFLSMESLGYLGYTRGLRVATAKVFLFFFHTLYLLYLLSLWPIQNKFCHFSGELFLDWIGCFSIFRGTWRAKGNFLTLDTLVRRSMDRNRERMRGHLLTCGTVCNILRMSFSVGLLHKVLPL